MAKKISGSVGKGGKNKPEDTQVVQELLNAFSKQCGFKKLDVDGKSGKMTTSAIAAFQTKVVGMSRADSRVDPGGKSIATLQMGPKKAEAEAKKAEKAEAKKTEKQEQKKSKAKQAKAGKNGKSSSGDDQESQTAKAKPQVKGDVRGLDKQLLAVLEEVSAHYGKRIDVVTGKEKVLAAAGGDELWEKWTDSRFKRGKGDPKLKKDEKLRLELDNLYNELNKDGFMRLVAKKLKPSKGGGGADTHATGRAVDLKRNTDSKVVAALATMLRREDEGDVIHFDDKGKKIPKKISEDMKKKWA